jgi:hypothetical protein
MKISRFCDSDSPLGQGPEIDGEELRRCVLRPQFENPEWFAVVFDMYHWREKGFLAEPGTYLDQAWKVPHLMAIVDKALEDGQAEHRAADERAKKAKEQADRLRGTRSAGAGKANIGPPVKHPRPMPR